ncbi:MAG: type 2 lantipeptide synthetase LanM family protein [Rudaea sp.]|nr:type 2 lantipeptide synthetase LanM family protein [Rudaea sp.]
MTTTTRNFNSSLGCLYQADLDGLAAQLAALGGLGVDECDLIVGATRDNLVATLHGKLCRLLIVELNAARVSGRLCGESSAQRWDHFCALSSEATFWAGLSSHYPALAGRVSRVVANICSAAHKFARDWASDKNALASVFGGVPTALLQLDFSAGDSHRGGRTVAILRTDAGQLVYKPRPTMVDAALHGFIAELRNDGCSTSMRVPDVVARMEHGWCEFVAHRYARDDAELQQFYRGIGHWLALMRLLGGSDLHAENLIAVGPNPVVIDCETLFTPKIPPRDSGLGQAFDRAAHVLADTVLATGLLPSRGGAVGWQGVDNSGVGLLRGQQPRMPQPQIVGAGTDEARIGMVEVDAPSTQNQPSVDPVLARYWPLVLSAFDEMTGHLRKLDATGSLRTRLQTFADCRVRVVPRATSVYVELGRMLWHPTSLHDEAAARGRAAGLLEKMAANLTIAPDDRTVIDAEVQDLLVGDIPYYSTLVTSGRLDGPRGTRWLDRCNLLEQALDGWRGADFDLDRRVIQATLISAYVNEGVLPVHRSLLPSHPRADDLDARRRRQAASILRQILDAAIHAEDGSIAWIAPVVTPTSRSIQPIGQDLYNGLAGVAVTIAAYLSEVKAERADPVDGLERHLDSVVRTLNLAEARFRSEAAEKVKPRPRLPGAYVGLGSQIWAHLFLAHHGFEPDANLDRARSLAALIPQAAIADTTHDILSGIAGAIPPLLALHRVTGDEGYLQNAKDLARLLDERAKRNQDRAHWSDSRWPDGVGGFSHGATGIAWSLTKLMRASMDDRYGDLVRAAFLFEESLFDPERENWRDLRHGANEKTAAAWCNGSVGIGLAHLDLDPALTDPFARQQVRRAVAATWLHGRGLDHCLCHGDFSAWELLSKAAAAGEGPRGVTDEEMTASLLTSLEDHGAICGVSRDMFLPGLMTGASGIVYQLLKMNPASALPSVLTLGDFS